MNAIQRRPTRSSGSVPHPACRVAPPRGLRPVGHIISGLFKRHQGRFLDLGGGVCLAKRKGAVPRRPPGPHDALIEKEQIQSTAGNRGDVRAQKNSREEEGERRCGGKRGGRRRKKRR